MKKTRTLPFALVGSAVLLALFAAGGLVGRALALPLPPSVVGLALVLLGLRIGVMAAAAGESPATPGRPVAPDAKSHRPALRAA